MEYDRAKSARLERVTCPVVEVAECRVNAYPARWAMSNFATVHPTAKIGSSGV